MLRSLAIDNLFSSLDSYINSARNYYIYHDSTTTKWNWIKWDANEAFGSYSGGNGPGNLINLAPNYTAPTRPLLTKIFGIPEFYSDYLVEYCSAFGAFSNAQMDAHIDAIKTLIAPHVAADPNKMFTTAQFNANVEGDITSGGGPGGGTIFGLKSFINARRSFLSGVLNCAGVGIDEIGTSDVLTVYPNPAYSSLVMNLPSGAVLDDVWLIDAMGRNMPVVVNGQVLDVSYLSPGIYMITADVRGELLTARFVKE
jgi:hypothetical protein